MPIFASAAAAAIVIAAAVVVGAAAQAVVAATAEQQDQDDDPPAAITTETIVIHKEYLRVFLSGDAAHSNIFRRRKMVQQANDNLYKKDQPTYHRLVLCFYFHRPSGYLPSSAIAFRAATT